jgi:hypothetical protein
MTGLAASFCAARDPAICDTTFLRYRDAPGDCLGARKVPVNDKTCNLARRADVSAQGVLSGVQEVERLHPNITGRSPTIPKGLEQRSAA